MLMFKRDPKPDRPRADSTLSESLSSSSAGLDTARFICQIAAIIGDGTIVIPGLKAIAQLGLEIIKIAQVRIVVSLAVAFSPLLVLSSIVGVLTGIKSSQRRLY